MEIIFITIALLILWPIVGALAAAAFGRFHQRNETRAYVGLVLHAVETRGSLDRF